MASTPDNLPALDRMTAVSLVLARCDAETNVAQEQIEELRSRRRALEARLSAVQSEQPVEVPAFDSALVDAIAADPHAMPHPDVMAAEIERNASLRALREKWQAGVRLIQQAIGKVDGDISAIEQRVATLASERAEAWPRFVREAHAYLMEELRREIAPIRERILEPLLAMEQLHASSQGEHGFQRSRLVPITSPRLGDEFKAVVGHYPRGGESYHREMLAAAPSSEAACAELVERFRASLPTAE